ncbi:DUF305 domain-containing protein [Streptomyces sp. BR123]|uniref:DUF305 domain-containing protein n=1 Tax=Streptomyces sp. BR123 TaxID=2749828 RepID=UPI0015C47E4E|nr:DUF305 domain-containing protein [Streptomyces sp. BR123]NXY96524.1 DUF305 domain-containing protein [Streptomyces sp. BR123]
MDMAKGLPGRIIRAVAAAGVLLALAGCRGGPDGDDRADGPPVIAPGRPGEKARTLSPGEAARNRPDDSPNAADRAYVRGMVEHHRQALDMTALAPTRARADGVKRLAERIAAAQQPEIAVMQAWLARHPAPAAATTAGGHDDGHGGGNDGGHGTGHGAMPGMATEQQMKDLAAARGADFDRLFLTLMTAHHEGALTMAGAALAGGNNTAVEEMANEVVATQSAEIHRMRAMG